MIIFATLINMTNYNVYIVNATPPPLVTQAHKSLAAFSRVKKSLFLIFLSTKNDFFINITKHK